MAGVLGYASRGLSQGRAVCGRAGHMWRQERVTRGGMAWHDGGAMVTWFMVVLSNILTRSASQTSGAATSCAFMKAVSIWSSRAASSSRLHSERGHDILTREL